MSAVISIDAARTPLTYALRYISRGFYVLPLVPGKKEPLGLLVPGGHKNATLDPELARQWWARFPAAGIGIAMKSSGLVAIDIDPRNGGLETMERLEAEHGPLVSDVLSYTGGGGEHRVFLAELVENLPGKLGQGVDLKADGFIVVEPSIHPSGRAYQWEASSDPLEGCVPSTLPGWIRDLSRRPAPAIAAATRLVDPKQVAELREALATLPADDYLQWVDFGNALAELGQAGFTLWDEWSAKSAKYDPAAATRKWRSFKPGAIRIESIFFAAQQAGWVNPLALEAPPLPAAMPPIPLHAVRIARPAAEEPVEELPAPPGILCEVAAWIEATSRKSQPAFALQAAIAFCCTVLGRRYVSTQRNWPSLYLLNIGLSSSGKEHAKWSVERLLEACGVPHLIGPAGYTSQAGVLSALHDQPAHLTVIDELGKALDNASVRNSVRDRAMLSTLMEVWGRADGTLRPQGYSTFGMSGKDAQAVKERSVRNPALTLLAMTTPDTFFDAIGSSAARDGFLNRFLIVESDIGRQVGSHVDDVAVPASIKDWVERVRAPGAWALVNPDNNPSLAPSPVVVPIDAAALELFGHFERQCIGLMNANDAAGLAEMFGRSNEIAMRLALAIAIGCDSKTVQGPHAAWAIRYVRQHALHTVHRLKTCVADSEFERTKQQVLACILRSGERGMTERDMHVHSRRFRSLSQRQQLELLNSMAFVGLVQRVEIRSDSGKGRPRQAWVAISDDADGQPPPSQAEEDSAQ